MSTTTSGLIKSDLGMEPYTAIAKSTDVVFVEEGDGYVAMVDTDYMEDNIPIDHTESTGGYMRMGIQTPSPYKIQKGDYMTQFYLGAVSVVGLFILFRMMQKSRA
jgi:hypothetical protein